MGIRRCHHRLWRRRAAQWLAALMLSVVTVPVVSGALQSALRHDRASCVEHAAHAAMACAENATTEQHHVAGGHCPLCLVSQHPPVLTRNPAGVVAPGKPPQGCTAAPARPTPTDRAWRWMRGQEHAPPSLRC